ncbi:hypothetical protein [Caballeronia arvi]|uniref:hypothetical protein n=1 Tax=Caballeronia arvi TaxID=1777135 RepID=UPI0007728083|nr:hypothetical protein [Caballeronia arvi]
MTLVQMAFSIMSGIAHMSFGDRQINDECRYMSGRSFGAGVCTVWPALLKTSTNQGVAVLRHGCAWTWHGSRMEFANVLAAEGFGLLPPLAFSDR